MERRPHARCAGHLLIECLVALSLFSWSLLGLAMLHSRSMTAAHGAQLRSYAALQLQDLAERMRMNRDAPTGAYRIDGCPETPASPTACAAGCPPAALAAWDIAQWCASSRLLLGSGFVDASVTPIDEDYRISMELSMRVMGTSGHQSVDTVDLSMEVRP